MKLSTLIGALLCSGAVFAQTPPADPSAQQIIDALKPKPAEPAPAAAPPKRAKTRNLMVEAVPAADAASADGGSIAPSASAAPAPAPPAQATSISLAIQFEVNSDKVKPASMQTLASLAAALQAPELSKLRFRLEGHTDGNGQPAYNRKLSAQRAEQVKRVLVANRVAPGRLVTEGKGSSELLNPADPGAAENRRVRIVSLEQ
ncbi:MAG: OmpA family protein [Pseudomonadota bacterium]